MNASARGVLSLSAWALTSALGLAACWDSATLNSSTDALNGVDASVADASIADEASSGSGRVCPAPGSVCGTECVDVANDPFHCGGCGISCLTMPPPAPTCEGTRATLFGPPVCTAGACAFSKQFADCASLNRECFGGQCGPCAAGFQDNDRNGTCLPDCLTAAPNCNAHGECSDVTGTPACVCFPGYSGIACATDFNDCVAAPCLNGGVCVDGPGSYTCNCVAGYTGINCETSPLSVVGLAAHYNAQNRLSLALDVDSNVMEWADLSGNNRPLSPSPVPAGVPVYGAALINGRPAVNFANAGMISAAFSLTTEVTVFAVIRYGIPRTWGPIAHHGSRDNDWSMEQSGFKSVTVMHWQSQNDNAGVELNFANGTNYIVAGRITGTGAGAIRYFSSTSTGAGTVAATGSGSSIAVGSKLLYVGASDMINEESNASIGELIYYARSLGDAERDNIIAYLKAAWGI